MFRLMRYAELRHKASPTFFTNSTLHALDHQ